MNDDFTLPENIDPSEITKGFNRFAAQELITEQIMALKTRVKELKAEKTRLEAENATLRRHLTPPPTPEDGKEDW